MITVADSPAPVRVRSLPPSRRLWWAMIALILVGVALTLWLSWIGSQLAKAQTTVLTSEYATVLGKSLTKWNLGYYVILVAAMVAAIYAWQFPLSPPLSLMLPVVTLMGVVGGGWCIWVMVWKLQSVCYVCLGVHVVNVALFFLAVVYAVQSWRHTQHTRWQAGVPPLPLTPVAIHVIVGILMGAGLVTVMRLFPGAPAETTAQFSSQPSTLGLHTLPAERLAGLPVDSFASFEPGRPRQTVWSIKGARNAPHRMVIFTCPTSPHCKQFNSLLNEVLARHPGRLRIDVRFYPLWHGCNRAIRRGHADAKKDACFLTRSALAVAMLKPETFAEYLDWIYDNQDNLDEAQVMRKLQEMASDAPWQATMDDSDVLWTRQREDVQRAQGLDVTLVPGVFLTDGAVHGGITLRNLEELLAKRFSWSSPGEVAPSDNAVWTAPQLTEAQGKEALELAHERRYTEAVRAFEAVLSIKPDWSEAAMELADILATCPDDKVRDGKKAVHYARIAQENAKQPTPRLLDVLASALAENGEFPEAAVVARNAVELYKGAGNEKQADEAQKRMEMYIKNKPYRMSH